MSDTNETRHPTGATEDELPHLRKMVEVCTEKGLLARPEDLQEDDTLRGLQDENTLLRFLRGNACDVDKSVTQFQEAKVIRGNLEADSAYNDVDLDEFEDARRMFPHWTGHRDKSGRPICLFDLSYINADVVKKYDDKRNKVSTKGSATSHDAARKMVVLHDYITRFAIPLCSKATDRPEPEAPITSMVMLVELSQFSMKQGWTLRNYVQDVSGLLSTCYPEMLHRVYMLNAPSYFGYFWTFLKKWLEPRTAAKLEIIAPADVQKTLFDLIDEDSIPAQFGGKCPYTHGLVPQVDEGLRKLLGTAEGAALPKGPIKWVVNAAGDEELVAVGTSGEKVRKDLVWSSKAAAAKEGGVVQEEAVAAVPVAA